MQNTSLFLTLCFLAVLGYALGRARAVGVVSGNTRLLHSQPAYHGIYVALWCGLPALGILTVWLLAAPSVVEMLVVGGLPETMAGLGDDRLGLLLDNIRNMADGQGAGRPVNPELTAAVERYAAMDTLGRYAMAVVTISAALAGLALARRRIAAVLASRILVERATMAFLFAGSTIAILTTIGIVLSLLFESIRFFQLVPPADFLFGLEWSPQTALRDDQVGSSGAFGAVPLFAGTLLIAAIAMGVAAPVGLMSAIYLSEYASRPVRTTVKPLLEVLAGVPTVVYGFFAALTVAPRLRDLGGTLGLDVASESALAAGVVLGIMIIPVVSSITDDVIGAVPDSLRDGSDGLGATRSETIRRVILPAALPGIVGGLLLAVSRAIGETMIVVMAAGLAANLTANPFAAVTTVTVQIVTLLVGDQEFDSAKTLAAFALGLVLFIVTLVLNIIALGVVNRYREHYE